MSKLTQLMYIVSCFAYNYILKNNSKTSNTITYDHQQVRFLKPIITFEGKHLYINGIKRTISS